MRYFQFRQGEGRDKYGPDAHLDNQFVNMTSSTDGTTEGNNSRATHRSWNRVNQPSVTLNEPYLPKCPVKKASFQVRISGTHL